MSSSYTREPKSVVAKCDVADCGWLHIFFNTLHDRDGRPIWTPEKRAETALRNHKMNKHGVKPS